MDNKKKVAKKLISKESCIYVAGHTGLVGSAIVRSLENKGFQNVIKTSRQEVNLLKCDDVKEFFSSHDIDYVFDAAAKVGGIMANNNYPADFIYENLMIQTNLIHYANQYNVKKFVFLGSSCIYPKMAPQPMKESSLLTGKLEETNKAYAIAKIAGIMMCQAYSKQYGINTISLMPTNLYGINDNFDPETSHVLPALIRKFHEAKIYDKPSVEIWGTGTPKREFLFADDLADAAIFLLEKYNDPEIINIGTGKDITIKELSFLIKDIIRFRGDIIFNTQKPNGSPRKLLDVSKLYTLGWKPRCSLQEGIKITYKWFKENINQL